MNVLLLPPENFSHGSAIIDNIKQLAHIDKVLCLQVGDSIKIGQLGGNLGGAIIDNISDDKVELRQVQLDIAPPAKLDITVVLALPRPKVLRRLIMDMTSMGVKHIILINSYRTQKSYWQSPMLERFDEFIIEGLQQAVDTILPTITLEKRFKPFVEDKLASLLTKADTHAIVAHPYSQVSLTEYLSNAKEKTELPKVVFIGSEGGWIDYEIELLAAKGCQAVTIGQRILRTEAAVSAILGLWLLQDES